MGKRIALLFDSQQEAVCLAAALEDQAEEIEVALIIVANSKECVSKPINGNTLLRTVEKFQMRSSASLRAKSFSSPRIIELQGCIDVYADRVKEIIAEQDIDALIVSSAVSNLTAKGSVSTAVLYTSDARTDRHAVISSVALGRPKIAVYLEVNGKSEINCNSEKILFSKVFPHSLQRSYHELFDIKTMALCEALNALDKQNGYQADVSSRTIMSVSNMMVLLTGLKAIATATKRLIYGAFWEKRWRVAIVRCGVPVKGDNTLDPSEVATIPIQDRYSFYADPFFAANTDIVRVEGLSIRTGLGEIIEIDLADNMSTRVLNTGEHYSYPYAFSYNGHEYLLPEVGSHSAQYVERLDGTKMRLFLSGLENERIVDATLFHHDDQWHLFFSFAASANSVLNLWVAEELEAPFVPHPSSPICVDPNGSRMAGAIVRSGKQLYRLGQNNERGYGEAISVYRIDELSPGSYSETRCGSISLRSAFGPHCLNSSPDGEKIIFDYYQNVFSFKAGWRRLLAKFARNRSRLA